MVANITRFIKVLENGIFVILILLFILSIVMSIGDKKSKNGVPSIFGYKPMIVLTGSMSSNINPGDIIIDKETNLKNIKIGDVITYRINNEMLITHRVIEIASKEGDLAFMTKGDANNIGDNNLVAKEQLIGRYSFRIPYAGYISKFARTIYGFILVILVPTILLIYNQVNSIILELKKEKAKKRVLVDNMD